MFGENLNEFGGKQVVEFEHGGSLPDPTSSIPRIRWEYDSEHQLVDLLREVLNDPNSEQLTGLVIGAFGEDMYEEPPTEVLELLVQSASRLPNLTTFFLGDMTYEENEVSWIYLTDMSPVWEAFPQLKHVGIRGSNMLSLGEMKLPELETLVLETGGLPSSVVKEVLAAQLPSLKKLELYLGDSGYGWDGNLDTVLPLIDANPFPQLEHLGLRDAEIVDEICQAIAGKPILQQLKVLDLSLGTLSDEGAEALLAGGGLEHLEKLDLHRHYLSDTMMARFNELPIEVDTSDPEGPSDERYVAIGE